MAELVEMAVEPMNTILLERTRFDSHLCTCMFVDCRSNLCTCQFDNCYIYLCTILGNSSEKCKCWLQERRLHTESANKCKKKNILLGEQLAGSISIIASSLPILLAIVAEKILVITKTT